MIAQIVHLNYIFIDSLLAPYVWIYQSYNHTGNMWKTYAMWYGLVCMAMYASV